MAMTAEYDRDQRQRGNRKSRNSSPPGSAQSSHACRRHSSGSLQESNSQAATRPAFVCRKCCGQAGSRRWRAARRRAMAGRRGRGVASPRLREAHRSAKIVRKDPRPFARSGRIAPHRRRPLAHSRTCVGDHVTRSATRAPSFTPRASDPGVNDVPALRGGFRISIVRSIRVHLDRTRDRSGDRQIREREVAERTSVSRRLDSSPARMMMHHVSRSGVLQRWLVTDGFRVGGDTEPYIGGLEYGRSNPGGPHVRRVVQFRSHGAPAPGSD